MKTIFISSFHNLISRNILEAGVLDRLVSHDMRVVLLVPLDKVGYFQKAFGSELIIIEGVSVPKKYFEDFLYSLSLSLVGIHTHIVDNWKVSGRYFKYYTAHAIHILFSRFFFFHKILRLISRIYFHTDIFKSSFARYKPDLVFTTDSFYREDVMLLLEAKRCGINTVGMIRSWDNATTKGVFLTEPDHIIVHNNVLKEEMISIHHVPSDKITVTGVPHYDTVINAADIYRERFFKEMGLDLSKKTILFAPGGKMLYKHDGEILALLKKHTDAGDFIYPMQFLVRFPPGDTLDVESITGDKNFIIDKPGTNVTGRKKESEMSQNDNKRLHHSLLNSDIVITLISTMAIDGTVFDKPVIVIGFDPKEGLPDAVKKFNKRPHFHKFLNSGLVTISHSDEEFVSQINMFLKNPDLNKEKREAIIERYAYKLDRRSSERVAECVLKHLPK